MKALKIFLLTFSLFAFFGCDWQDNAQGLTRTGTSTGLESCDANDPSCDMTWVLDFNPQGFPQNIELFVNDRLVFTECNRQANVTVTRNGNVAEVVISRFLHVTGTEKVRLKINNLGNCSEAKVGFYENGSQRYTLKMATDGSQFVFINLNI